MRINLHIERVVFEGDSFKASQIEAVHTALELHLRSLLQLKGQRESQHVVSRHALKRDADHEPLADAGSAAQLGNEIALAVVQRVNRSRAGGLQRMEKKMYATKSMTGD